MTKSREELLEEALLEYVERYGLLEKARHLLNGKETNVPSEKLEARSSKSESH